MPESNDLKNVAKAISHYAGAATDWCHHVWRLPMGRIWTRPLPVVLAALIALWTVGIAGEGDRGHGQEAVPSADHIHGHPGYRPERRRRAAIVESITKPGAEIHDYQPTPLDIVKAQSADLVLWNGFNLERWFERFFENVQDVPSVVVTEGIEPMGITEGPYTGKPNPHAWMSPSNALIYIENIRKALVEHDPANAEVYDTQCCRLRRADQGARRAVAPATGRRARGPPLAGHQRGCVQLSRPRLRDARGLSCGRSTPTSRARRKQVRHVIDLVRENQIPVVFSESTISDRAARQVAKETGAQYGGVLYVDLLSAAERPVPTYLDLLKVTVETIARGLQLVSELSAPTPADRRWRAAPHRHRGARPDRDLSQRPHRDRRTPRSSSASGTICGLVGINGSGKSTLFKAIMGFVRPPAARSACAGMPAARGAEAQHRRLRAAVRGRRLELPGAGPGRRHDGPLRPHGLPAHPVPASTGARSTRRSSASA